MKLELIILATIHLLLELYHHSFGTFLFNEETIYLSLLRSHKDIERQQSFSVEQYNG